MSHLQLSVVCFFQIASYFIQRSKDSLHQSHKNKKLLDTLYINFNSERKKASTELPGVIFNSKS